MTHRHMIVTALLIVGTAFVAPSAIAAAPIFTEMVYMGQYNPADDTYSVTVNISASPCPDITYNTNIPTTAKNPELAKNAVKDRVDKITNDIQQNYNKCHPH